MKLSVRIITYNHEKYIAQAIDSALMQKVNFDYEIVIGEDCSTDNTRNIVIDFQNKYPDKIRLLLPEKNLGGHENSIRTMRACRGEYIALLDGDDYWTSSYKLQKQVDFLDSHPECAMCFHNATKFYEDGSREPHDHFPPSLNEILTLEDLLDKTYILPVTVMFRSGLVDDELPEEFRTLKIKDWLRFILIAQHGKIGYINKVMGAYRIHSGGGWSRGGLSIDNNIRIRLAQIECYEVVNEYYGYKYHDLMRSRISDFCYSLAKLYGRQENWNRMKKYLLKGFFAQPFNDNVSFSFLLKSLLISHFPSVYRYLKGQRQKTLEGMYIRDSRAK